MKSSTAKRLFLPLCLLLSGIFYGFSLAFFEVESGQDKFSLRLPASIDSNLAFDYTNLSGDALQSAIRQRLISNLSLETIDSEKGAAEKGFKLGHFVFLDSRGNKTGACGEYPNLVFRLEADGQITNGQIPTLEIQGRCEPSEDLKAINPLFIPIKLIQAEPPGDSKFAFEDRHNLYLKFKNVGSTWPKRWILKSFELHSESKKSALLFESDEIKKFLGTTPVMIW